MALKVGQDCRGQERISLQVRWGADSLPGPGKSFLAPVVLSDRRYVGSVLGHLGQHQSQQRLEDFVNVARGPELTFPDVLKQLEYRLALEWIISRGEVVERHSRGPDINLVPGESLPTVGDLWWLEGRGALTSHDRVVLSEERELLAHSEICDLEDARLVQEQVPRFDIFVNDSFGVKVGKSVEKLSEVVVALPDWKLLVWGLVQHVLQDSAAVLQHLNSVAQNGVPSLPPNLPCIFCPSRHCIKHQSAS